MSKSKHTVTGYTMLGEGTPGPQAHAHMQALQSVYKGPFNNVAETGGVPLKVRDDGLDGPSIT